MKAEQQLEGVSVSAPTVRNILNNKGIGNRYERWLRLEQETAEKEIELSAEQVAFIEKQNPCFREACSVNWPGSSSTRTPSL